MSKHFVLKFSGIILLFFSCFFCMSACSEESAPQLSMASSSRLMYWFDNGLTGKKICFVGDSTTSNATELFSEINNFYIKEGEALYGVSSILNYGQNGASLRAFLSDQITYGISAAISAQANLYIINYGINDVRLGGTSENELVDLLRQSIEKIKLNVPNADIVLVMPNSFLSTNTDGLNFVQPNSNAQFYSDLLSNAYTSMANRWDNVVLLDTQNLIFGHVSLPDSIYMQNQIHPSSTGYKLLAKILVDLIGKKQAYSPELADYALQINPLAPYLVYPRIVENPVYYSLVATGRWVSSSKVGDANGYIDFDWLQTGSSEIMCGDILQMAQDHTFKLPPSCHVIPIAENTRIYNLGADLPPITMTGGTINIWRAK